MKLRRSIAAAGAAAALAVTGGLVLPAVASAHTASHALEFIAVQKAKVTFTKTTGAEQDTDVTTAGKTVGFDVLYYKTTPGHLAHVNWTVDTSGGFLYGTFTLSLTTGALTDGKVTGGTGSYTGATGTLRGTSISSTREAIKITYSR